MKKLYVLDAVNFLFRSYYAIGPMTNPQGESTGALYGFIRSVYKIIKEQEADYLICVFDGPKNTQSRKKIYEQYKAHRDGMPEDLYTQLNWAIEFCQMAGIPYLSLEGVEADDTIGAISTWSGDKGVKTYLCSSDKDLAQLVNKNVLLFNIHKDNLIMDRKKVKEVFGVYPDQIIDLLALMGDTSDNIPGLEGVGPKTAATLLNTYGSIDNIFANLDKLPPKKKAVFEKGEEIVDISKQLATIQTGLKIPKKEDFFRLKEPRVDEIASFYRQMHFMTLLKEIEQSKGEIKRKGELDLDFSPKKKSKYHLINEKGALKELIKTLQSKKELCIDTETTELNPHVASLVGIGLSSAPFEGYYIPLNGNLEKEFVIESIRPLIENSKLAIFGHNIKYDLHILHHAGLHPPPPTFDTMVASYLLAPHKQRHGLDLLALEHFGKVKTPISDLIGKGKKATSMDQVPIGQVADYCGADVDYTFQLKELFEKELKESGLLDLMETLEAPLISVLANMEETGVYLDANVLEKTDQKLTKQIHELEKKIFALAKSKFNLNSPKQLGKILFDSLGLKPPKKTKTGYSTSAQVLETLKESHPIIANVLEYRNLEKLRSTYTSALPSQINEDTGRIHCTFNQSVAATGRLSSQDPNLQNIPIRSPMGKEIRSAFKPQKKEWSFVGGDYSQIELRLLAHLSQDPTLLKAFRNGEDIHTFTASLVYGVPIKEVTKSMRHGAKAVNFGILYGQSAFGLSKEIGVSKSEAAQFIETYFKRYPKIRDYLKFCVENVRKKGYSLTLLGRKRPIPEIDNKNPMIRASAERLAINTPLQGTAADLIKMAMILIDRSLKKDSKMILQIHDELIFETPDSQAKSLGSLVKKEMEHVIKLDVPLIVDIHIGKNWGEC